MAKTFRIEIVNNWGTIYDGEVESLVAPGADGYFGVLANHAPLIASLVPGRLTLKDSSGKDQCFCLSGGLIEVADNRVKILADAVEKPDEIDYSRACEAEKRARDRLEFHGEGIDLGRAEEALQRALNRQKIAKEFGHAGTSN